AVGQGRGAAGVRADPVAYGLVAVRVDLRDDQAERRVPGNEVAADDVVDRVVVGVRPRAVVEDVDADVVRHGRGARDVRADVVALDGVVPGVVGNGHADQIRVAGDHVAVRGGRAADGVVRGAEVDGHQIVLAVGGQAACAGDVGTDEVADDGIAGR